jgi:glycosyltransferase involved in cell wall biosynthesis
MKKPRFIVACPQRTSADYHAAVLVKHGMLRKYFIGTRRPTDGIPEELTCFIKAWGAVATLSAMVLPSYQGEWVRSAIHPLYDAWVLPQIQPGDNIISSYGYANYCFKKVKKLEGKTFLDAGNSHPAHFWDVITEEHHIWGVKRPPYPPHWNQRARQMLDSTDYIICPSRYVEKTYLERGFTKDRLLYAPFPTDLSLFKPDLETIPPANPLWVICTGSVSLRKGFPYLLEAVRLLRKDCDVRLMLTHIIESSMITILKTYDDIPIEWAPSLNHRDLANRLKKAHVFALLSLEDGFARTVSEALACGLPAVVTPHTGARDFILEGKNGYVVPIRDAAAAADAIQKAADIRLSGLRSDIELPDLSFQAFEAQFIKELARIGTTGF